MKIAYFDCFSGISGDMCLGAIVDAGVSLIAIEKELKKIPLSGYKLSAWKVRRKNLVARKVDVLLDSSVHQFLRKWKDVAKFVEDSSLPHDIKEKGLNIFGRLFSAEADVHGRSPARVHLHELAAIDCMVDIFGTLIGLNLLGIERLHSSPLNLGSGFVRTANGILPVPAPATAAILKGVPVYSGKIASELTTPTGAAIIKELAVTFGEVPLMQIEKTGIGAGEKNFRDWPNVLRIFIGDSSDEDQIHSPVTVIETNIDDMSPQIFGHVIDMLYR
ncbi:MAG: nickel pincer cofactor biosynthesis protein LarC, partial [Nitrospirota bacterium]